MGQNSTKPQIVQDAVALFNIHEQNQINVIFKTLCHPSEKGFFTEDDLKVQLNISQKWLEKCHFYTTITRLPYPHVKWTI